MNIITEPTRKSLLDVVRYNLRAAGRVSSVLNVLILDLFADNLMRALNAFAVFGETWRVTCDEKFVGNHS